VNRRFASLEIVSRCLALVLLLGVGLAFFAARPVTALAKDGHGEVSVTGVCGGRAAAVLRLKSTDNGIELRFEVEHGRPGVAWRVALVQERRVAWKGVARTTRPNGSFEVRRTLQDLPGADAVTASAWGPRGLVCRATTTLPDA
jgi:hypothetical protein